MKTTTLIERLDLSEASLLTEARAIFGVVLIRAGRSANRRLYREPVLQAAAPVFEAAKAYANHPRGNEKREGRSIRDLSGWYSDVEYRDGALRATRHFLDTEAGRDAWAIAQAVVEGRAPATLAGLSINAVGTGQMEQVDGEDVLVVESITHAVSVDDVDTPAAGGAYALVAGDGDTFTRELLAALSYEEWFEARPDYVKRAQNEWRTMRDGEAVKAAKAEADQLHARLSEAQETVTALVAARDAALVAEAGARRALAVTEALATVGLPAAWKADLRAQLQEADPAEWSAIIDREKRKAQSAGGASRATVTGAGQQVAANVVATEAASPVPMPDEDVAAWQRRLARTQGR